MAVKVTDGVLNICPIRYLNVDITGRAAGQGGRVDLLANKNTLISNNNTKTLTLDIIPFIFDGRDYAGDSASHDFGGEGGLILANGNCRVYSGTGTISLSCGGYLRSMTIGATGAAEIFYPYTLVMYVGAPKGTESIILSYTNMEVYLNTFTVWNFYEYWRH